MDRDHRWERVEKAYRAIRYGEGPKFEVRDRGHPELLRQARQRADQRRRVHHPSVITGEDGKPLATVEAGDSVIFYNYRGDRPRELHARVRQRRLHRLRPRREARAPLLRDDERVRGRPARHVAYKKTGKMKDILAEYVAHKG
jgi:2,3-bisphosphoglycerate-independent phosphoglycerate mutase